MFHATASEYVGYINKKKIIEIHIFWAHEYITDHVSDPWTTNFEFEKNKKHLRCYFSQKKIKKNAYSTSISIRTKNGRNKSIAQDEEKKNIFRLEMSVKENG